MTQPHDRIYTSSRDATWSAITDLAMEVARFPQNR